MMSGRVLLPIVLALLGGTSGCGSHEPEPIVQRSEPAARQDVVLASSEGMPSAEHDALRRLYGSWMAHDVKSKIGEVTVKLEFRQDGPVRILAWSDLPFVGKVRDKTAAWNVEGDIIECEVLKDGQTVRYWFEGDKLVIEYKDGKTVKFRRV